jgi:hypothetical protein
MEDSSQEIETAAEKIVDNAFGKYYGSRIS